MRLLILDDHPMLRKGLVNVLNATDGIEVVGEAGSISEALRKARELQPDAVVVDLYMHSVNGFEVGYLLNEVLSGMKVILLSSDEDAQQLSSRLTHLMLRDGSGRHGFGDNALHNDILNGNTPNTGANTRNTGESPSLPRLTQAETRVLRLLVQGYQNQDIAKSLFVTVNTAKSHVQRIFKKLKVKTRTEAVRRAIELGLVELGDESLCEKGR